MSLRLFIALDVPDTWREYAAEVGRRLAAASGNRLRLVQPSRMHLTLRFLGDVDEDVVPALREALDREAPPVDLELTLEAPGTFGPRRRTNVVWVGVDGDVEALAALAARVDRASVAAGLPPEERPFRAHLTVARVHPAATPAQRAAIADAVRALDPPQVAPYRPAEVLLMRSHLQGSGPRYEVLSRHR